MKPWVCIPLHRRNWFTLVDASDVPLIAGYNWYDCGGYVRAMAGGGPSGITTIALHRLIMGAQRGQIVDHINGDNYDNRRANLRFATNAQNAANTRYGRYADRRGVYKGVGRKNKRGLYPVSVTHGAERRSGQFKTEIEAARQYDEWARELHGEFARVNFPREGERGARDPVPERVWA